MLVRGFYSLELKDKQLNTTNPQHIQTWIQKMAHYIRREKAVSLA